MSFPRGTVVFASDPFKSDAGRPFLVISDAETPFHGDQYVALALTTRTWYDERIELASDDWVEGGAPESSSVMPWSVNAVNADWISHKQGRLTDGIVRQAIARLTSYLE